MSQTEKLFCMFCVGLGMLFVFVTFVGLCRKIVEAIQELYQGFLTKEYEDYELGGTYRHTPREAAVMTFFVCFTLTVIFIGAPLAIGAFTWKCLNLGAIK